MGISIETLLIAIVSGLGGGALGSWLQVRGERHERFRERLIVAADDYSTGLVQAILALRDARTAIYDHGFTDQYANPLIHQPGTEEVPEAISGAIDRAGTVVDEAVARLARIGLLFGDDSPAGKAAEVAAIAIRASMTALQDWPEPDVEESQARWTEAHEAQLDFNRKAKATIWGSARARVTEALRRRRRREPEGDARA